MVMLVPYFIFVLYIAATGFLIFSGLNFHEDGLTVQVVGLFLLAIICFGLALVGTIKIIWGGIL